MMRDFELNVKCDPLENDICVYAVMSDYADVRNSPRERKPIVYKMNFASGFSVEEIVSMCSCELAINWFEKYGADAWGNRSGLLTKLTIEEGC